MISVVVPVLDEAATVASGIRALRQASGDIEIVVVDGGSTDGTGEIAGELATVVEAPRRPVLS